MKVIDSNIKKKKEKHKIKATHTMDTAWRFRFVLLMTFAIIIFGDMLGYANVKGDKNSNAHSAAVDATMKKNHHHHHHHHNNLQNIDGMFTFYQFILTLSDLSICILSRLSAIGYWPQISSPTSRRSTIVKSKKYSFPNLIKLFVCLNRTKQIFVVLI